MFVKKFTLVTIAAGMLWGATARAQDAGALLDLLVRKNLITDQEAEEVRADLTKEAATTSAGKLKLSTPITELELYGDARMRYEIRSGESGPPDTLTPFRDTLQRNRARYRLRLGLRGTLADDWFFGLRLETSTSSRSTNVTFADESTGGPFNKDSDRISVGQAYLGYSGLKDFRFTAGRMPNPLVTTPMTWDGDINPEGLSEQWKHTFNISLGARESRAASVEAMSKDGKSVAAVAETSVPRSMTIDVFANLAQFVYDDANPENPIGDPNAGVPNTDAFLLAWQIGAKFNFTKDVYLQVAPTLYNYTGNGNSFNSLFVGDPAFEEFDPDEGEFVTVTTNQTGVNSLFVFNMPVEFGWKIGELPMRIFGDFAVNLDADDRATAAGHPDKDDQRFAYQIGIGIGKLKVKRDWQVDVFWQHVEQYALDPNLVDSDIFDSRVNMEGVGVRFSYALSDAVVANLTYAYGEQADDALGTGGVGDIGVNPVHRYQIFQADLNVKF